MLLLCKYCYAFVHYVFEIISSAHPPRWLKTTAETVPFSYTFPLFQAFYVLKQVYRNVFGTSLTA